MRQAKRHKGTEAQRTKGTEAQRHKGKERHRVAQRLYPFQAQSLKTDVNKGK